MAPNSTFPIVERERELSLLKDAARSVRSDGARLALVTGDAGIGKSTLHAAFQEQLDEGWQVEHVHGYHTDVSFDAPFGHLALDLGLDPDVEPAEALAAAVGRSCRARTADGPLLLVVEDLHYLDPITVSVLAGLLDQLVDAPVLVLATSRHGTPAGQTERHDALAVLRARSSVLELDLSPLTVAGIGTLISAAGERSSYPIADAGELHRRTSGNPFFVDALLRADPADPSVPWTVAEMVLELLTDLGPAPRAAAELLAVEGGPLPLALLDELAGPDAVVRLERAGLVIVVGSDRRDGSARLRHALVAESVRAILDPVTLAGRHRSLAEAAAANSGWPGDAARHWSAAGDPQRAAPFAAIAADQLLASGSHARATDLYEIALRHPPEHPRERAALLERGVSAASYAGRVELARRWGELAIEARTTDALPWEAGRGWVNPVLLRSAEDAATAWSDPLGLPSNGGRDDDTVLSLIVEAQRAIEVGRLDDALVHARAADAHAAESGDDLGRVNAALALMLAGDLERADAALVAVIERTEANGDLATASVAWARRGRLRLVQGSWGEFIPANDAGTALIRRASGPDEWANLALGSAFVAAMAGLVDDALARCAETDGLDAPLVAEFALAARVAVAVERGHIDQARPDLDALLSLARALGVPYYAFPVLSLEVRAHLLTGELDAASRVLDEMDAFGWGAHHDYSHDILVSRAVVAALRGRTADLSQLHIRLAGLASQHGGPQWLAGERFAAGLLAESSADPDDASGHLHAAGRAYRAAAEHWEAAPRFGWAADAWCAALRLATDDAARAEARQRASTLAETHCLDRVRWMLGTGLDAPVTDHDHPVRAPALAGLTDREAAVVTAAAGGFANREIADQLGLSERTVRNYLSSAFAKLGVTRRSQLAPLIWDGDEPRHR